MGDGLLASRKVVLIEDPCHQVHELWEQVSRLHSIRDDQKEIGQIFSKTMRLQEPERSAVLKERQAKSAFFRLGNDDKGWKLVTSGTHRRGSVPWSVPW